MNATVNKNLALLSEHLDIALITEEQALYALVSALQEAHFAPEFDSVEDLLEQTQAFMQSKTFRHLPEATQSKIQKGWKMVFGKLRKVGQGAADIAKGFGQGLAQMARDITGKPKRSPAQIQAALAKRQADIEAEYEKKKAAREKADSEERDRSEMDYWKKREAEGTASRAASHAAWKSDFERKHGVGSASSTWDR